MVAKEDILATLRRFRNLYPEQEARYREFSEYVEHCSGGAYCDRKNFRGHLTVSGFIFSPDGNRVLMLRHRTLGRWLQPGGHLDPEDCSLTAAVYREIREETGLSTADLEALSSSVSDQRDEDGGAIREKLIPIGLNSHPIPANPVKNEAAHTHYDFRFAFRYRGGTDTIHYSERESEGFRWVALEELRNSSDFEEVVRWAEQRSEEWKR